MARSDLLIALVKAGASGDKRAARTVAEAIIAEEKAKQHTILAERLLKAIQVNSANSFHAIAAAPDGIARGRDFISEIVPRRQLDDLVLTTESRRIISEILEEQQRADILRSHGLEPRHKILLVGAPGTGKTSLAEAIAEAIAVPLFIVRYESMIGSYLGETATRLKRVFDYARTTPCVLFFDEFDTIGKERGDEHETGEIKRVVSSLLMQVDELPSYTVVIAATNHPELLDRAAWRRFQAKINLPTPTVKDLADYIDQFTSGFGEALGQSSTSVAKALGKISYAEAEQFCLDLRRRQVLSMGERPLKKIVSDQLRLWRMRSQGSVPKKKDIKNDGTATSTSADT